jgi:hypothetical protein
MKTSTTFGLALLLGTFAQIATMSFHPTGIAHLNSPEMVAREMRLLVVVHALGLLSIPITTFGFVGLTQRLGWAKPQALFALIVYFFSAVAIMLAAIADGLLNAALIPKAMGAAGVERQMLELLLAYNHQINQACAQVYVVGSSLAIIFWSAALARLGSLEKATAWFGGFVGLAAVMGMLTGHVRLNAHGFGFIVLLQALWVFAVVAFLIRSQPGGSTLSRTDAADVMR